MSRSQFRERLDELTQTFIAGLIQVIRTTPLQELLAEIGAEKRPTRRDAGIRRAHTGGAVNAASRAPLAGGTRTVQRRSNDQIVSTRDQILRVLQAADRPLGAAEIARRLNMRSIDLAFPMNQLRAQRRVEKSGERAKAVYTLTSAKARTRNR